MFGDDPDHAAAGRQSPLRQGAHQADPAAPEDDVDTLAGGQRAQFPGRREVAFPDLAGGAAVDAERRQFCHHKLVTIWALNWARLNLTDDALGYRSASQPRDRLLTQTGGPPPQKEFSVTHRPEVFHEDHLRRSQDASPKQASDQQLGRNKQGADHYDSKDDLCSSRDPRDRRGCSGGFRRLGAAIPCGGPAACRCGADGGGQAAPGGDEGCRRQHEESSPSS